MPALFEAYPVLRERIAWIPLADLPTPVEKMQGLGRAIDHSNLWIKRDDLSSRLYGGNKVRKLEFILADARRKGFTRVITYGGVGTNHGLATTIHARRLGMKTTLVLVPQPISDSVQQNLLLDHHFGADINCVPNTVMAVLRTFAEFARHGRAYVIPPGGSSTLGCLGYVDAAFELRNQIAAGLLPQPRFIFCALGSKGTMAGLMLGTRLAGLKTEIIGVRVAMEWLTSIRKVVRLANRTAGALHRIDPHVPEVRFTPQDVNVISEFFGGEYGGMTPEGRAARELLWETQKIGVELTYTAKTVAAMLESIKRRPEMKSSPVLYWHTYSGVDFSQTLLRDHDHTRLPAGVQWCFRENLLPWRAAEARPAEES